MPVVIPIAVTSGDATSAQIGVTWTLDGSGSYDPDGDPIVSYLWVINDKPAGSSATIILPTSSSATFVPDVVGTYRFFLTVTSTGSVSSETDPSKAPDSAFSNISVTTLNLELVIPATGQRGWGDTLYDNFQKIDADAGSQQYTCNASVTIGDLIYIDTSGEVQQAVASALLTSRVVGICVGKPSTVLSLVKFYGVAACNGSGTSGGRVWLSPTSAGEMTSTVPTSIGDVIAPVGINDGSGNLILQVWPEVEIT